MKSLDAGISTHVQQEVTSLTSCFKMKRLDGSLTLATVLDSDVTVDVGDGDGPLTYLKDAGFDRSAIESSADFKIGNMEIQGIIQNLVINKQDIRAGLYDFADVKIFQLNWKNPTDGIVKMQRGKIGQVSLGEDLFVAEFRSLFQLYLTEIGAIVTEECPADLFDNRCQVVETPAPWLPTTAYGVISLNDAAIGSVVSPATPPFLHLLLETGTDKLLLEDSSGFLSLQDTTFSDRIFVCTTAGTSGALEPVWNLTIDGTTADGSCVWTTRQARRITATIDTVTSRSQFTINTFPATDAPDIFFREGTALFLDGPNSNLVLRREIKDWNLSTRTVTMWRPMPFDVTAGEQLLMSSGCNKSTEVCNLTYFNIFNHRGWPHVPGTNNIIRSPTQGG